ncbi:MAG TPA: Tex family protein [Thermoanaerobaculia bacterium]|nr:Tex family protein [Thermoanaerobaculia bacterium]
MSHVPRIASELDLRPHQIERTLALHAEGATVPFIARYRKEATGNLDELQIQHILDRAAELKELDERRATILRSIDEQQKLTPELAAKIASAKTRTELEDLYLPYRPKRRTRATIAREKGLEPLADYVWGTGPRVEWTSDEDLAGARDICAERVSEDAELRRWARAVAWREGVLSSSVLSEKKETRSKFEMYYDHREPLAHAPSHRVLAIFRGEAEEFLNVRLRFPDEQIVSGLKARVRHPSPMLPQRELAIEDAWKRLLSISLEGELRAELKQRADAQAIDVFGQNLRNLLLAPPAGNRRVLALDPGLRTGIKVAMLDETGKLLETATLYTERSAHERALAEKTLRSLIETHRPDLIAIGNGTGSREAEAFVQSVATAAPGRRPPAEAAGAIPVVSVSEQGASIYSASEVAREEFPDLDVSLRSAVSIGRRLQYPLGELVKLDPKSIGVGQYQHDVNQTLLKKKLGEIVDWCVNLVGVDANTASPQLLEHVSGIGPVLARRIVEHRNEHGAFASRRALLDVRGLGARAFEQCAGFLRIRGGHPLDDSAVHPERYALVEQMVRDHGLALRDVVGNAEAADRIEWKRYVHGEVGEPTLRDIIAELKKPGRDPRGSFEPPKFREDVQKIDDLRAGMELEGVVTNVTAFGAFVDVGVHQDGLVHVSQLAGKYVKDPHSVVRVGDRVRVKVVNVDLERRRIALSMKPS